MQHKTLGVRARLSAAENVFSIPALDWPWRWWHQVNCYQKVLATELMDVILMPDCDWTLFNYNHDVQSLLLMVACFLTADLRTGSVTNAD
jgi:hypothetical protein